MLAVGLERCRGRGCGPRGLYAAWEFYEARRRGLEARPRDYYLRPPFYAPKQSFHNSLNLLLKGLGHSPLFKRVLYGRLGALVCRGPAGIIVWEYYGPRRWAPACPPPHRLEEWPGPRVPHRFMWRGGVLSVKFTTEWNVYAVIHKLKERFGAGWFTASDAAELLAVTTPSASRLLTALEEAGFLESERVAGKNMKRYRVARA